MNKISDESRIVTYFEKASVDKIEVMFDLVRNIVNRRMPNKKKKPAEKPKDVPIKAPTRVPDIANN